MDEARRVESYPNYNLAYLAKRLTGEDYQQEIERDGRYAVAERMADAPSAIAYAQEAVKGYEAEAEECLKKEFMDWLQGSHVANQWGSEAHQNPDYLYPNTGAMPKRRDIRGVMMPDYSWNPTWWGQHQLTHLPGVREFLREQAERKDRNEFQLNMLAEFGPQNLEEAWAYFKHWVKRRPIGPEFCLENVAAGGLEKTHRAAPRHMGLPGDLIAGKGQRSLTRATPAQSNLAQYESPRTTPQVSRLERLYATPSVSPEARILAPQVSRLERSYATPSVSPEARRQQNLLPDSPPDLPEDFVQVLQEYSDNMTPQEAEELADSIIRDGLGLGLTSPEDEPDSDENIPVVGPVVFPTTPRQTGPVTRALARLMPRARVSPVLVQSVRERVQEIEQEQEEQTRAEMLRQGAEAALTEEENFSGRMQRLFELEQEQDLFEQRIRNLEARALDTTKTLRVRADARREISRLREARRKARSSVAGPSAIGQYDWRDD